MFKLHILNIYYQLRKGVNQMENQENRQCLVCGKSLTPNQKCFCSKECRNNIEHYPTLEEITDKYKELKSWSKVAAFFGITKKIVKTIRKIR